MRAMMDGLQPDHRLGSTRSDDAEVPVEAFVVIFLSATSASGSGSTSFSLSMVASTQILPCE